MLCPVPLIVYLTLFVMWSLEVLCVIYVRLLLTDDSLTHSKYSLWTCEQDVHRAVGLPQKADILEKKDKWRRQVLARSVDPDIKTG